MAARIAMVAACPFPSPQGSQVFVGQMCERLTAAGHTVHLVTYGQGEQVEGRGYRHHRIRRLPGDDALRSGPSMMKPLLDAMLVVELGKIVRSQNIEIVHAHNYEALLAALAVRLRTGTPVVYHSHNLMGDELATYFDSRAGAAAAGAFGRWLDRCVPRRADHSVALCEYTGRVLRQAGVAEQRLSVIPPAVDDEGPAGDAKEARRRLGLPIDGFLVGYCGNLDRYQNLELLLSAARRLGKAGKAGEAGEAAAGRVGVFFATHGGEPGFERLVQEAAQSLYARVLPVDSFAMARRAVEAADVLVLPRRAGSGYPVKLLNYMSAAKPVITAGCGGKVLTDGVDGIVVADGDPAALAGAIAGLRTDAERARALGAAGRDTFLARLTWEVVLPRIEAIYKGLLGPRQAGQAVGPRPVGMYR